MSQMIRVQLSSETDLTGFKQHARALFAKKIAPENVHWQTTQAATRDLFDDVLLEEPAEQKARDQKTAASFLNPELPTIQIPAWFAELCQSCVLHREPQRFAWLYQMLWRLQHEPALRRDALDPQRLHLQKMAQSVRRDLHKMKAFVRFRPVLATDRNNEENNNLSCKLSRSKNEFIEVPLYVAWFEPEHYIVQTLAPWFARRFSNMHWAILTPDCSVRCHPAANTLGRGSSRGQLEFGPGGQRELAPAADAGEQLWLTYYQHIFNPARLKLRAMQKEMPRKYWRNLPEAQLIAPLRASAQHRAEQMIKQPASQPEIRKVTAAKAALHQAKAASCSGFKKLQNLSKTSKL